MKPFIIALALIAGFAAGAYYPRADAQASTANIAREARAIVQELKGIRREIAGVRKQCNDPLGGI